MAALAERLPVVLLDTGLVLEDDHADYTFATRGRVISARAWMTPRNNLGVQTQIVAGAKAFVGTCGSIAWLAPRLGVDTSALFVDPKWLHAHLPVAMRAYHRLDAGRFAVADLRAVDPLGALGGVACPQRDASTRRMNVLFIARHFTYFRNFESVIAALAERGHRVHLAADREEALGGRELVDRLAARYPAQVTVGFTPILQWGRYRRLSSALRLGLDYLRYSDPRYEATPKIRERAYERTPLLRAGARAPAVPRAADPRAGDGSSEAVPRQAGVDEFIAERSADLLLITPLIELGSPQLDYVRAARALGIRSALCVWSWDHLSSKALIRVVPDTVIVWNETQREEAQRFHGIAADRVIVTGAQCFDHWFDRHAVARPRRLLPPRRASPARGRSCSTSARRCSGAARRRPRSCAMGRGIRQSSDAASARHADPRPAAPAAPRRSGRRTLLAALSRAEDVVLWGSNPVDAESRADYFDSLYHAAAVVGLNTSALVEAAIVDRPVFTILLPEFRENQEGTFHFHHLLTSATAFSTSSRSLDEHVAQLAGLLLGRRRAIEPPFVEHFIRPRGAAVAATPVFADAVETIARAAVAAAARVAPAWLLPAAARDVRSCARRPPAAARAHLLEPGEVACISTLMTARASRAGRTRPRPLPRHRRGGAVARRQPRPGARVHRRDRRRRRRRGEVPDAHRRRREHAGRAVPRDVQPAGRDALRLLEADGVHRGAVARASPTHCARARRAVHLVAVLARGGRSARARRPAAVEDRVGRSRRTRRCSIACSTPARRCCSRPA